MTNFENYYEKEAWTLKTINEKASSDPKEFIRYIEENFEKQIKQTVDLIERRQPECKILMLAGPSSSGKTTTAKMLKDELIRRNIWTTMISLDDFYVGVARLPVLEDGSKDFESIQALDMEQLKKAIKGIVYDGFCDMPTYDFSLMAPSTERRQIEVPQNGIIIIEGIHALNPIITEDLPKESVFKIYVSVENGVELDDGKFISPMEIRLTRRVLRDFYFRDTLPNRTIQMWDNVCRGENLYIQPFKDESDVAINSFHAYELCVMASQMFNACAMISSETDIYDFIQKLRLKLTQVQFIDSALVPETSLLKEFIK